MALFISFVVVAAQGRTRTGAGGIRIRSFWDLPEQESEDVLDFYIYFTFLNS